METVNEKDYHDTLTTTPRKSGTCLLHTLKEGERKEDNIAYSDLIKNNVLCIFSYSLKYMNKKSLNKWLKKNIKAHFLDTFVPKKKPYAYIRFKNMSDLKAFEKLIENKQFHENDNMSIIKINKTDMTLKKRKLSSTTDVDTKRAKHKENLEKAQHSEEEKNHVQETNEANKSPGKKKNEFPELKEIIKMNRTMKNKKVENFVTPFYKYAYSDQVKIKHNFLKKCRDQILLNLQNKWTKQNLIFGESECSSTTTAAGLATEGRINRENDRFASTSIDNKPNRVSSNNILDPKKNSNGEKTNRKNLSSTESCLNQAILKDTTASEKEHKELTLSNKLKDYYFEVDDPIYPNDEDGNGRNAYRNKCEFTIAHDENNDVEIGFVVRKLKTVTLAHVDPEKLNEDPIGNYSENNISNNVSPLNETQNTMNRNRKQKQTYFLKPIVENIDNCIHIHEGMKAVVREMKSIIKDSGYPVFDRVYKTGVWRLLILRSNSEKELMITVQTYQLDQKKKRDIKKLLINRLTKKKDEPCMTFGDYKVVSLFLQEHENSNDATDQSSNEHLWGKEFLEETLLNNKFYLTPSCFFQVNRVSCELLYNQVINYINMNLNKKKNTYIFDLCCGTGTIGISAVSKLMNASDDENIQNHNVQLIGIDICEDSITCAKKNAEINNIKNCKFTQGRVEEQFQNELKYIKESESNIIALVDPPRCGLANSTISLLSSHRSINQIIYVSCNPLTLISNVTNLLFQNECLRIRNMSFVDMFPHTFHVECIVNIEKI